jgi:hypothetical protein
MLGLENAESRRASILINALTDEEITLGEFRDAIRFLKAEALQVAACLLSSQTAVDRTFAPRLWFAHRVCRELACAARPLC